MNDLIVDDLANAVYLIFKHLNV